ncbi:MAG: hypothetical protein JWN56_1332 [Sphingobacteriales bacterium]|nr:hypothetical protein [Sphingobacteriales bacterium]
MARLKVSKKRLRTFLIFLLLPGMVYAQLKFDHLSVENGLSQSSVLSIAQDAKGFMWFGTRYGLNKYNTQNLKIYVHNPNDTTSLSSNNYISALLSDRSNTFWIGSGGGLNKYIPETDSFEQIIHKSADKFSISDNTINCILEDKKGRIWVGTNNGLNLLTHRKKNRFISMFTTNGNNYKGMRIFAMAEDISGTFWLGTSKGLVSLRQAGKKLQYNTFKNLGNYINTINDNYITTIIAGSGHTLWLGTKYSGLIKFDKNNGSFRVITYTNKPGIVSNNIRKIIVDKKGRLWIGTLKGLSIFDSATEQFMSFQHDSDDKNSLSQNSIYDIFQDKNGSIWIGTYYGGVNVVYPNLMPFHIYQNSKYYSSLSSNVISAIIEDKKQNLWIGTEAEGLNYYDRVNSKFHAYKSNPKDPKSPSSVLVKSIIEDKEGKIWIGYHQGGLDLFNAQSGTFKHFRNNRKNPASLSSNDVNSVFEDSFGRFWVGTNKGLNLFNSKPGTFKLYPLHPKSEVILTIFEDSRKNVWLGTENGPYILKKGSKVFNNALTYKKENLFREKSVNCITEDSNGDIWIGLYHSKLIRYNPNSNHFKSYQIKNGLPSNNVLGVLEDNDGNLWISTDNGLSKFNLKKGIFKNYNAKDGLPGNEFNYGSYFKDSQGELFFGTLKGLISFFPNQVTENPSSASVVFTGLKLFNKPVNTNSTDHILKKDIGMTKEITFSHDQNIFALDFAVLNYIRSNKNEYAYKLDGFEKNWNYVTIPSATYTNLPAGEYTFLAKGTNNDGVWSANPAKLTIRILPPLWKTWWAYFLYVAILAAILFVFIRFLVIRALLKREQYLHSMKLNFFTNISHEIRTPLTLILGPLEKLLKSTQNEPALNRQLLPIKNNADRLMRLITELMDFRKAETGHMKLYISPDNIIKFTKEIYLSFQNLAISRNISYSFESDIESIELFFDKDQLEKVLFNLLSNAFKFTPDEGQISVSVIRDSDFVKIKVTDNGKGIPPESQDKLFSNFYQVDEYGSHQIGSGVGLALSKSIVELHNGTIHFESSPSDKDKQGSTCFCVILKTGKDHFNKDQLLKDYRDDEDSVRHPLQSETENIAHNKVITKAEKKYTVLLVEDNPEVRLFIKESLDSYYHILECGDGLEGWETATEAIPDLIISDVMMPQMDGLELCRKLKLDDRTSHIPVILLTARAAYIHQLNGLETGADAYVVKPFSIHVLELNVRNLLASRETMRQKFSQVLTLQPSNVIIDTYDETFLSKIIQIIEDNITDPDFGVPVLSSEAGMSQPVLYKKIRALTGLSVNDFVKSIRLKKAAQLLEQNRFTVYEVAYATGFSDRKYFSKEFRKQFNQSPTEFTGRIKTKELE